MNHNVHLLFRKTKVVLDKYKKLFFKNEHLERCLQILITYYDRIISDF
jgi:hypothetical protein